MSVLETVRDALKSAVATAQSQAETANQQLQAHQASLAAVEAEIAKTPTLDDVRAMIDRVATAQAHTG